MTEDTQVEEKEFVDVRLFGIPKDDWQLFRDIIETYSGDRIRAFHEILVAYMQGISLGALLIKMDALGNRVETLELEQKQKVQKTFGMSR